MKMTFGALAALLALCTPLGAQENTGEAEYMVACAVCHGESGMGDGPMAEHLNIAVPPVTRLSAMNDGVFPFLEVLKVVDGRSGVRGHGTGMMPIWGDRYRAAIGESAGPYGAEVMVRGRLLSLVYYLESIQE